MTRTLRLTREALSELTTEELRGVVGAATVTLCGITVLAPGCASDPRICHYETAPC